MAAQQDACALQPQYPLPPANGELRALSERIERVANDPGCLADAGFHAWRGAVLMSLGRSLEAVEPLERALLTNPLLFGAQMDLAQAHALQGDRASAIALLQDLRDRAEVPAGMSLRLDREIAALQAAARRPALAAGQWQHSWQLATLAGYDTNLNNAPSATEITLTLPQGDVTLPLDPSSQPKKGAALLAAAQWQGLKPAGQSVWVLQADMRSRHTGDHATGWQQTDFAANWLQAPLAPRQWVARGGASYFRFGGATVLWATRASLQYQWEGTAASLGGLGVTCRPSAGGEFERRLYPASRNLDGYYRGGTAGVLCRPAAEEPWAPSVFSVQARLGEEQPFDAKRAGSVYRRQELRGHWEGRLPWRQAQYTVRWSSTRQADSAPYSVLLGNEARRTLRHTLQLETAWPINQGLSLITQMEGGIQRSNLPAFASRQLGLYLGLRWESM
ncbi:MAG: hypothetical protein HY854_02570 [Burkholderiales bacterium]|nr:hypothetical protein [Burkholderiales bacterium]